MKRTFATMTMLVAVVLTVSLPNTALAELTFGKWATGEGYTPPGSVDWLCSATSAGITSLDGVSSYTNLQWLYLQDNQISSLAVNQFQGLTNLRSLQLDANRISSLAVNQFQGLTNLQWLDLEENQLSSLDANAFQYLTNLQYLNLSENQLSSLDANAFQDLTNLRDLDLQENQISSLAPNQFQDLTNLRWLYLDVNRISSLSASQFQGLTNLQTLRLFSNQISSLAPNQFQGLANLQWLYLQNNQISSLAVNQFEGLTNLRNLSLDSNQISSLAVNQFQGLANLQGLNLQHNQISSLAPNQFQGLTSLQMLRLNGNQISSLDLTGFESTALHRFNIDGNPIAEVILEEATLSQLAFDMLMIGDLLYNNYFTGIAELAGIASVDFTAADMTGVDQFDEMFAMADLETLTLTDALFSDAIITGDYAEVWDLISALELSQLDALTVDQQLYVAMQTNLDTWDAAPNNVLTVVPEPSTMALLAIAGLALFLWRRKATSR